MCFSNPTTFEWANPNDLHRSKDEIETQVDVNKAEKRELKKPDSFFFFIIVITEVHFSTEKNQITEWINVSNLSHFRREKQMHILNYIDNVFFLLIKLICTALNT